MQLQVNGDATFVKNWQRGYSTKCPVTGVKYKEDEDGSLPPSKEHYEEFFPKLLNKIVTPVAFAILAPDGWSGEKCWYEHTVLPKFGWEPVAWAESSHKDKTFVQLFMLRTKQPDLKERPVVKTPANHSIPYSGKVVAGSLPYLGCSSILSSYDEPKMVVPELLKPPMYNSIPDYHKKCLHLIRLARPASTKTIRLLKDEGFRRLISLNFFSYWVRGKTGMGLKSKCTF